jgi:hypothetical protein
MPRNHKRPQYPREPQKVSQSCWYYEEPRYIKIVIEERDKYGTHITTVQHRIPWKMLASSVRRHRRIEDHLRKNRG